MNIIGMEFGITRLCPSARRRFATESVVSFANFEVQTNDRILATSLQTTCDVLEALSRTACAQVVELIASNTNCSAILLDTLAKHSSTQVKIAVSENPNTDIETLLELAFHEDSDLRYAMAENPLMPIDILKILSEDENPYVSCRAVSTQERLEASSNAPQEILGWTQFRSMETAKSVSALASSNKSTVAQVNRFFNTLYRFSKAI